MFRNILIANRGAIASRILRACHELGVEATVVYSSADADLPYVLSYGDKKIVAIPLSYDVNDMPSMKAPRTDQGRPAVL